jgi:succinoglycan biosynthesis transport protein ExoP
MLSQASVEAYRTLRATLLASGGSPGSILVTGAGQWEGKTTTAINLAASLAWSGASVILIEADVRQPSVGPALGLESILDLRRVLSGDVSLEEALVESDKYGPNLRVLLARGWFGEPDPTYGDELLLPAATGLISTAQRLADFVVIDSPPLAEVIDALELARRADAVLLVSRLGQTQITKLRRLGALLDRAGVDPVGMVLVGTEPRRASDSYGYVGAGAVGHSAPPGPPVPARRLRASGKTRSAPH